MRRAADRAARLRRRAPALIAWLLRVSTIWKTVKTRMMTARISDSAAP